MIFPNLFGIHIQEKEVREMVDKTFYFCAAACKKQFEEDPMKYTKIEKEKGG